MFPSPLNPLVTLPVVPVFVNEPWLDMFPAIVPVLVKLAPLLIVVVPVYVEASFYADALVWAVNPAVDYITDSFGNQVAVTAYNTGVYGPDVATTIRLQKQFVEQSEFEPLGFISVGETLGGTDYNV